MAFSVVLTGGIASGKSAVSARFAALGVPAIDADHVARELVEPGMPALEEIVAAFGADLLTADGALNRRALRALIFDDATARTRLNAILHPRIQSTLHARAQATPEGRYALLVVPLFAENRSTYAWVDRVLVIDVPRAMQRARLIARDDITPQLADAMLDAQATREQRLAMADDVIRNDGPLDQLDAPVAMLHARYLQLSRAHASAVGWRAR